MYDKNQRYLGVIREKYLDKRNIYLLGILNTPSGEISFNDDSVKKYLAGVMGIKNLFGKVNKDRFREEIEDIRALDEYSKFWGLSYEEFLSYLFLEKFTGKSIRDYIEIEGSSDETIKGYILFDITKAVITGGKITINEDIDYIQEQEVDFDMIPRKSLAYSFTQSESEWNSDIKPIYGKVTGYPIHYTDIMGAGEGFLLGANISDFGGRNHSHETRLRIKSGNCEDVFDFPVILNAKADMNIQLYMGEKNIEQIFCDGVIYKF